MRVLFILIIGWTLSGCVHTYADTTPTHVMSETDVNYVFGTDNSTTYEAKLKAEIPARPTALPVCNSCGWGYPWYQGQYAYPPSYLVQQGR